MKKQFATISFTRLTREECTREALYINIYHHYYYNHNTPDRAFSSSAKLTNLIKGNRPIICGIPIRLFDDTKNTLIEKL